MIIRRTLEDAGFAVERQFAWGGLAYPYASVGHALNVVFNVLWFRLTGRTVFRHVNRALFTCNLPPLRWRRLPYVEYALFGMLGCVIKARRHDGPLPDVKAMSPEKFA